MDAEILLKFFKHAGELKNVKRAGWIERGLSEPESVADHTFRVSVMVLMYSDILELNTEKALKMALLHDLQESVTGDITPQHLDIKEKKAKEEKAMKDILKDMPAQYLGLWHEYSKQETPEAKLVAQVDKLEMLMQAVEYEKRGGKVDDFWDIEYEFSGKSLELYELLRQNREN